jgi:hypothetical protein
MVTIRVCSQLSEAFLMQSALAGSGIDSFLPDEYTVQNDWLWTNAIGGIRVQVAEGDAGRAEEICGGWVRRRWIEFGAVCGRYREDGRRS